SVRGSIDLVLLMTGLARLRHEDGLARATARDAAYAALSGRIRIADGCDRPPESVLDELLEWIWPADSPQPRATDPDEAGAGRPPGGRGKADRLPAEAGNAPRRQSASAARRNRTRNSGRRTISRAELTARHPAFTAVSPGVGRLGQDAF